MKRTALYNLICLLLSLTGCKNSSNVWFEKGRWLISDDGKLLLVYNHTMITYKPYVAELYTPSGVNVLRDNVPDHTHHHGLMMALNVDGINFWEETAESGYQVPAEFAGRADGGFSGEIQWMNPAKTIEVLTENRQIESHCVPQCNAVLTTWTSICSTPAGKASIHIRGEHYYGLGMRFVESMDNNGEFEYAIGQQGTIFRGEERLSDAPWCAYRSFAGGKAVTVAMFNDPTNCRPATWFTMKIPFAYLSATMRLHEKPLEVTPDKPLRLRYGIAVWDGYRAIPDIETLYQIWLQEIKK